MLHIVWLLIKWILILLGILLGLVLLAVLLLLFCPVRYQAWAKSEETDLRKGQAGAQISWLFRGLRACVSFQEGKSSLDIYVFGISLDKLQGWLKRRASRKKAASEVSQKKKTGEETAKFPSAVSKPAEPKPAEPKPMVRESAEQRSGEQRSGEQKSEEQKFTEPRSARQESSKSENGNKKTKWFSRFQDILKKLRKLPGQLHRRIEKLIQKLKCWKAYFSDEQVQEALGFLVTHCKKLLKHIFPTKLTGQIVFGCEDPAVTGTILAVLGMTIPLHQNRLEITPLFEVGNQLRGSVRLKGRIYGFVFAKAALDIYRNKNIKYARNYWKHKEDPKWKMKTISKKQ